MCREKNTGRRGLPAPKGGYDTLCPAQNLISKKTSAWAHAPVFTAFSSSSGDFMATSAFALSNPFTVRAIGAGREHNPFLDKPYFDRTDYSVV
jgi:hypothetical protein